MVNRSKAIRSMTTRLGLAIVLLLAGWAAHAAEIEARLDRNRIVEGETVTLILQTDDPAQSLESDFSVLENDFLLLDQRSETQMSIVGGRQTSVVRAMLTLEPKRAGQLRIPALQFPGFRTQPLLLNVEAAPELAPGEMPPVFIELSLDPETGPFYVHAQLSLTVKIFYQQNLTEATINPPTPEQASVRLLDEVPFPAERNGVRYRVLQRRYAIFPERSGTLTIPPMRLTGRLIERPGAQLWQPSVRGRRVTEESRELTIEVLPRPKDYQGDHWLPARQMTISQQVSEVEALRVGEPVTRTVIVDAVGLEENMLEEPAWPAMTDARIYPDQPQGISRDDGQWVRGHKEFRYAIVPETAGELVLPEIRLDWWDTVADEARAAVLPEVRVKVAPSDLAPMAASTPAGASGDAATIASERMGIANGGHMMWRYTTLVFALLWLGTLALWWRRPPARRLREHSADLTSHADETHLLRQLRQACQKGEAGATRALLRRWLKQFGPDQAQGSIVQFAAGLEEGELRSALREFNAAGYREGEHQDWDGRTLWKVFTAWRSEGGRSGKSERGAQPDLYTASG